MRVRRRSGADVPLRLSSLWPLPAHPTSSQFGTALATNATFRLSYASIPQPRINISIRPDHASPTLFVLLQPLLTMMFVKALLPVLAGALFVNAAAFNGRVGKREDVGSILDAVTSDAGSVFSQGTAAAGSVLGDITSLAGDAATFLTSLGGDALTVISSADGELITLAPSGFGEVTSFAGSVYTEITGDAASLLSQATSAVGSLVGDSHSTR
ncbi:hypothetical protein C8Q73DRAFT_683680 [Cubamyces lactineus]|nr:hypothetical protein C8Q73DRAFT_683680 [Cubamyces lactineus]